LPVDVGYKHLPLCSLSPSHSISFHHSPSKFHLAFYLVLALSTALAVVVVYPRPDTPLQPMAHYGFQGGYPPNSTYSQPSPYQPTAGVVSSPEYTTTGYPSSAAQQNTTYGPGVHNNGVDPSNYMNIDNSPSPSTVSNATSGYQSNTSGYQVPGALPNVAGYPGVPTVKGHSISPPPISGNNSNAMDTDFPNFRWWIPSEGISRTVIHREIQHYLGSDALQRPGVGKGKDEVGSTIYRWITFADFKRACLVIG
jgi:hypothetical protein